MPELPEVETVVRSLEKHLAGLTITDVDLIKDEVIRLPRTEIFMEQIIGRKFQKN